MRLTEQDETRIAILDGLRNGVFTRTEAIHRLAMLGYNAIDIRDYMAETDKLIVADTLARSAANKHDNRF